ncbi:hypothetical protein SNE40_022946 [Patella caerulea]|uniref:C-type lectin domain-containing protein n=1 Tax=Patella caerulea TaxID=87958 RepID=A0AAN8IY51_PATCE
MAIAVALLMICAILVQKTSFSLTSPACPNVFHLMIELGDYLVQDYLKVYYGLSLKQCGGISFEISGSNSFSYNIKTSPSECYIFKNRVRAGQSGTSKEGLVTYWRLNEDCPSGYTYNITYNVCFKAYFRNSDMKYWSAAMSQCEQDGGFLYLGNSKEKMKIIHDLYHRASVVDSRVFVGASDIAKEGEWKWFDGSFIAYWKPREPNNRNNEDCAALDLAQSSERKILDFECNDRQLFICEIPVRPR